MAFLTDSPTIANGTVRNLNEVFQINPTAAALAVYTIELTVRAPLLSSDAVRVELLIDNGATPVSTFGEVRAESAQLAGLGLVSIEVKQRQTLVAWVPAGFNVLLKLTADGTGAASVISATEIIFD